MARALQDQSKQIFNKKERFRKDIDFNQGRYDPTIKITQIVETNFQCNEQTLNKEGCMTRFTSFKDLKKHLVWKKLYEAHNLTCGGQTKYTAVPEDCVILTKGPSFKKKPSNEGEYFEEE